MVDPNMSDDDEFFMAEESFSDAALADDEKGITNTTDIGSERSTSVEQSLGDSSPNLDAVDKEVDMDKITFSPPDVQESNEEIELKEIEEEVKTKAKAVLERTKETSSTLEKPSSSKAHSLPLNDAEISPKSTAKFVSKSEPVPVGTMGKSSALKSKKKLQPIITKDSKVASVFESFGEINFTGQNNSASPSIGANGYEGSGWESDCSRMVESPAVTTSDLNLDEEKDPNPSQSSWFGSVFATATSFASSTIDKAYNVLDPDYKEGTKVTIKEKESKKPAEESKYAKLFDQNDTSPTNVFLKTLDYTFDFASNTIGDAVVSSVSKVRNLDLEKITERTSKLLSSPSMETFKKKLEENCTDAHLEAIGIICKDYRRGQFSVDWGKVERYSLDLADTIPVLSNTCGALGISDNFVKRFEDFLNTSASDEDTYADICLFISELFLRLTEVFVEEAGTFEDFNEVTHIMLALLKSKKGRPLAYCNGLFISTFQSIANIFMHE